MRSKNNCVPLIRYISNMLGKIMFISCSSCVCLAFFILVIFVTWETHPEFGGLPEHFIHMCITFIISIALSVIIPSDEKDRLDLISLLITREKYDGEIRKDDY